MATNNIYHPLTYRIWILTCCGSTVPSIHRSVSAPECCQGYGWYYQPLRIGGEGRSSSLFLDNCFQRGVGRRVNLRNKFLPSTQYMMQGRLIFLHIGNIFKEIYGQSGRWGSVKKHTAGLNSIHCEYSGKAQWFKIGILQGMRIY